MYLEFWIIYAKRVTVMKLLEAYKASLSFVAECLARNEEWNS